MNLQTSERARRHTRPKSLGREQKKLREILAGSDDEFIPGFSTKRTDGGTSRGQREPEAGETKRGRERRDEQRSKQNTSIMATSWTAGLLPKGETQAADFVQENPNYDGRGIIVGVLDTGCDAGAIGLSLTSEGLPKIIDIVDCSGSGDVVMGPWTTPEKDSAGGLMLIGMTGRSLKLNPRWTNPTGQYRLGYKRAIELYPRGLKERVKEQRKKQWMETQRKLESQLQKELVLANASGVADDIEECKVRIAQLRQLEKDNNDECGPLYDCLVFYDGYVSVSSLCCYVRCTSHCFIG